MNILITGSDGLIGSHLVKALTEDTIVAVGRDRDIRTYTDDNEYDVIFHCAAKKDLKYCHTNFTDAYDINVNGTANILKIKHRLFVHLSTDMVEDGRWMDMTYPLTCYGLTKRDAELKVEASENYMIIRSGLVYAEPVKWIHDLINCNQPLKLYYDRWRVHTEINDYIAQLLHLVFPVCTENDCFCNIEGVFNSQLGFVVGYLNRNNIQYNNIIPVSRQSTEHGRFSADVIKGES